MNDRAALDRADAVARLAELGISGRDVYFIDLVPLIEMLWADGKNQPEEARLLRQFAHRHVDRFNAATGEDVLTRAAADTFLERFLAARPDPALLAELRGLVKAVRLAGSDRDASAAVRDSLLATCLDIAASAVTHYPFLGDDRFNAAEKKLFFEVLDSLR